MTTRLKHTDDDGDLSIFVSGDEVQHLTAQLLARVREVLESRPAPGAHLRT